MLFTVMVNELVNNWSLRAKFVDDLKIMEAIPRNSPSIMYHIISDVQEFASNKNMHLNPAKCKEMGVSFLHYNSCELQTIATDAHIEEVTLFKLLGVYISNDLTLASRHLYALGQLMKTCVPQRDLVSIYCSVVHCILEYARVVFANLPKISVTRLGEVSEMRFSDYIPLCSLCQHTNQGWYSHPRGA